MLYGTVSECEDGTFKKLVKNSDYSIFDIL